VLDKAGIPHRLPSDEHDPGLLLGATADGALADAFLGALARHRQFDRETDPPRV
jgi:catalase